MVFFEGETEEQALPIFAKYHFGQSGFEMGIDFVGVGSYNSYLPFLWFAESLNIPWLILSDSENLTVKRVKKQFKKSNSSKEESDVIVFLDDGNDFEKQLIRDGFQNEIKKSIASFDSYNNGQDREAKEPQRLTEIEQFSDGDLYREACSSVSPSTSTINLEKKISPRLLITCRSIFRCASSSNASIATLPQYTLWSWV
jgi:putative ATP-dependent endonuclease of OLD family